MCSYDDNCGGWFWFSVRYPWVFFLLAHWLSRTERKHVDRERGEILVGTLKSVFLSFIPREKRPGQTPSELHFD